MAVGLLVLMACLFVCIPSLEAKGRQPYLIFKGETLPNNSYIDVHRVVNTRTIECRIEGVHRRLSAGEDDDDDGDDRSISAYWYDPDNKLISGSTDSIATRYRGEGIFLEVRSEAITQGLYQCRSRVGRNGNIEGVVYIGLYISEGELLLLPWSRMILYFIM